MASFFASTDFEMINKFHSVLAFQHNIDDDALLIGAFAVWGCVLFYGT